MEDISEQPHWVVRNKRPIIVLVLLIVVPIATARISNWFYWYQMELHPEWDPTYEPSHNMTVWIKPESEEFTLHLDFYGSEDDSYAEVNRYIGSGIRVEPGDAERHDHLLYAIPDDILSVWVRIYYTRDEGDPFVVHRLEIGHTFQTEFLGREFSILLVPYHG